MPRKEGLPIPEEEHLVEVTEDEFLEFCFEMINFYLTKAQTLKNTVEQNELNRQLGKYTHYYKDEEGNYRMVAKRKPKMGFI